VAPGKSIASLRDPGSYVDAGFPDARVGDDLFKGSGTSQAAAFVSGAVALLLQQRPGLTPDQVKALLKKTATPLPLADDAGRGAGELNVLAASLASVPGGTQTYLPSRGTGFLEAARGRYHVAHDGTVLNTEHDILGTQWDGAKWAAASSHGSSWVAGEWMGVPWTGACACTTTFGGQPAWSAIPWDRDFWDGNTWDGNTWDGNTWDGNTWDGNTWDGNTWDGNTWDGNTWDGNTWDGNTWDGNTWDGNTWDGNTWDVSSWD
ncbi:MAG: S8 family serine peptidase, partial [Nocardioidaceae bacterium]